MNKTTSYKGIDIVVDEYNDVHIPLTGSIFEGEQAYISACQEIDEILNELVIYGDGTDKVIRLVIAQGISIDKVYDPDEEHLIQIAVMSKETAIHLRNHLNFFIGDENNYEV